MQEKKDSEHVVTIHVFDHHNKHNNGNPLQDGSTLTKKKNIT